MYHGRLARVFDPKITGETPVVRTERQTDPLPACAASVPLVDASLKTYNSRVPDLSLNLAGLKLANPTMTCSGTCGYAFEYADFMDLSKLGAFVTKSITREERPGNEPARIVETRGGMLNAIGLANVGLRRFLDEKVPQLEKMPCPVVVNVA